MRPFLEEVAEYLLGEERPLHEQTIVLPSKRAAIFLQRALQAQLKKVSLAPRMLSIEELINEATGLERISRPELYFRLFETFKKGPRSQLRFEEYSTWASSLIQDFNEIDRYLVNAESMFSYLGDLKRIDQWNLEPGEHTQMLNEYLRFWPELGEVYHQLKTSLLSDKKAWQGLTYRVFAEESTKDTESLRERYQHFYFIGFNALNSAEEQAFLNLTEAGLADFYWDIDDYYYNDTTQEAGMFLRNSPLIQLLEKRKQLKGRHQKLSSGTRQIRSLAVAGDNLQAVVAANQVRGKSENEREETAIILSDEALLPALLNNINKEFPSLNLSMGLSLQNTPLAGFFELLLDFPLDLERNGKNKKDSWGHYHHQKWNSLLSHPICLQLSSKSSSLNEAKAKMQRYNLLYPSIKDLNLEDAFTGLDPEYFKAGQNIARQYQRLSDFCLDSLNRLHDTGPIGDTLFGFQQLFQQTADLLHRYPYLESFEHSLLFYRDLIPELSMDLKGEPLKGMQVMGWLESRCLDFKHLIVLSLNEGILPKGRSESSLLPFEVKRKYQIPTFLEKDAVFAYHFYRLMQGAEQIDLLYSTAEAAVGVVEPSRFLRQLELEWPQKNARLKIEKQSITGRSKLKSGNEEIKKDRSVLNRLIEIAKKGFSPSALYIYLKDPLQFYYERVLGLKPEGDLVEELDLPAQGSAIHRFLELSFSKEDPQDPQKRIAFSPNPDHELFRLSQAEIKTELKRIMLEETNGIPLDHGPNLLHLENMSLMLQQYLQFEKRRIQNIKTDWKVLAVESDLHATIELKSGLEVRLHGNADRIDVEQDEIHIIDYKTGTKEARVYWLRQLVFDELLKKPHAVQLLSYAYMQYQMQSSQNVKASIMSLSKISQNPIGMRLNGAMELSAENLPQVKNLLQEILEELFNPEIPFKART